MGAHPDDIEFSCGGTIATMVDEGWDVRYVIVTSGQRGTQDASITPEQFGKIREAESVAAAAVVGVTDVTFLGWMDSEVTYGPELLRALSREFRRHRPHRLFAMKTEILPTELFVNHPDHRAVGTATLDITITGGTTAAIFPELLAEDLEPWQGLEEIWVMGPGGGSTVVDITSGIDRKIEALRAHVSQIDWDVDTYVRARLAEQGELHGYAYAESFRVIGRYR